MFTPEIKLELADDRGEIYSISLPDNREMMLFHCKAGYLRGGHSHDADERMVLLTGKMVYHKLDQDGERSDVLVDGDSSFNPAGTIHMGEFLEDTWLFETKMSAQNGTWSTTDYEPYREHVRKTYENN